MRTNNDPNGLKVQLRILKERVKYLQEKNDSLVRQNSDLQKITEEKTQLKIAFEIERQKTKHFEEIIVQIQKKQGKKTVNAKMRGFLTSMLFLIASILAGFGINMLTSMPPNLGGWLPIITSVVAYIIATLLATFLVPEGENG